MEYQVAKRLGTSSYIKAELGISVGGKGSQLCFVTAGTQDNPSFVEVASAKNGWEHIAALFPGVCGIVAKREPLVPLHSKIKRINIFVFIKT